MAFLKRFRDGRPAGETELGDGELLIGSDSFNNMVLDEKNVGKRHALIEKIGGDYIITDLGSEAGTVVGGAGVDEHILKDQDIISMGEARIVYAEKDVLPVTLSLLRAEAAGKQSRHPESDDRAAIPEFDFFNKIAAPILACADTEMLPAKIMEMLFEYCGVERGVFFFMDDSSGRLVPRIARKMEDELADRQKFKSILSIALRALDHGNTVITSTLKEAQKGDEAAASATIRRVMMSGPLLAEGQPQGALYVDARQSEKDFDAEAAEIFEYICRYTALAWLNAVKFQDSLKQAREYRELLDRMSVAVFHLDGLGRVLHYNAGAERIFNLDCKKVSGTLDECLSDAVYRPLTARIRSLMPLSCNQERPGAGRVVIDTEEAIRTFYTVVSSTGTSSNKRYTILVFDGTCLDDASRITSWEESVFSLKNSTMPDIEDIACIAGRQKKAAARGGQEFRPFRKAGEEILAHAVKLTDLFEAGEIFLDMKEPVFNMVKLDEVFSECLEDYKKEQKHIVFEAQFPEGLPDVPGDREQLATAMKNIIDNAVNSMKGPGRVSVLILLRNRNIITVVEDTGSGMDEETRTKAFLPGFSGFSNGHGFGLAMVKKIIACHGGTVDLLSLPGQGTTVSISIPVMNAEEKA